MRPIALLILASAFSAFAWDANDDLLSASRAGDLAAVKAAVEKGAAVEAKTPYGQTPLYLAAMNGHEEVVRFLLDKGASTDIKDTFYKAPMLGFVIQRKHWAVARMLASKTSKPDDTLVDVADSGRAELVQAVLDAGKPSQQALDKAYASSLEQKHAEVSDLLKKAGAHEPPPPVKVDAAVLDSYAGTYHAEQFPVDLKVIIKEGRLYLDASGQQIGTKAVSTTRFASTQPPIELEFDSAGTFTLKQGNGNVKFTKVVPK